MTAKEKKRHFHIQFEVKGIGVFERWAWYKSRDSFVKALAIEFEKNYPFHRRNIFIKVLNFEEIKHPEKVPQPA